LVITLTPETVESRASGEFPAVNQAPANRSASMVPITETNIPRELQGYILRVQKKIADNMAYPATLINTGWEGSVVLKLTLDKKGDLRDARISKSSGYKIFDDDAVRLVRSLSFPAFPSDVSISELNIDIPITYRENR
jgi:protein TonB